MALTLELAMKSMGMRLAFLACKLVDDIEKKTNTTMDSPQNVDMKRTPNLYTLSNPVISERWKKWPFNKSQKLSLRPSL